MKERGRLPGQRRQWRGLTLAVVPALGIVCAASAWAIPAKVTAGTPKNLIEQLETVRHRVIDVERGLLESLKSQKQAQGTIKRIQTLMELRQQERQLGKKRLGELENTIRELESRRVELGARVRQHQDGVRRFLVAIEAAVHESPAPLLPLMEREKLEAPRRKVLGGMASRGLREIEILRVDLADANKLEERIQDEKQQLAYLLQDLNEKEQVLELNRQLQLGMLQKKHDERVAQLENYRRLKTAEEQVEGLIQEFNARRELERVNETERVAHRAMNQGEFARLKGKLPLPLSGGKVLSAFGRAFDPLSKLHIFRKGIDIGGAQGEPVRAISAGKIAYSGQLPDYGQVVIVDHGEHFYSLCAHLGTLTRKAGEPVTAGDTIGATDDSGTPVYFEIRARNVAVNPLQWISN
ncbi:MAG: peptidoglycan DD-metalloendopeptidase family protein [Oligoflexia bacterium]|nr:peptidoglycan DD-metalloendopeptidase family protein [Oligoflexia bacterium]